MRCAVVCVLTIVWVRSAYGFGGSPGGPPSGPPSGPPEGGPSPPAAIPPEKDFSLSQSCFKSLGTCIKQLSAKLKEGEPFSVPNVDPPCSVCNATEVSTIFLKGRCAKICSRIPQGKDKSEETFFYRLTFCFKVLHIECRACEAKMPPPIGTHKGDTTMNWKGGCVNVMVRKEPWSGDTALVLESQIDGGKPDPAMVDYECTGTATWIEACKQAHEGGGFLGIITAAATGMFPSAANQMFKETEGKGDNSIGKAMGCNSDQITSSEEECGD